LYVEKRGTSYYLKNSLWINGKTVSNSNYLGKNVDVALIKLESLVQSYELMAAKDSLLAAAVKSVDKMKLIKSYLRKITKLVDNEDEEFKIALNDLLMIIEKRNHCGK